MSEVVTDVLLSVLIAIGIIVIAVGIVTWLTVRRLNGKGRV